MGGEYSEAVVQFLEEKISERPDVLELGTLEAALNIGIGEKVRWMDYENQP